MDWLLARQDAIEAKLGPPAPGPGREPGPDGAVRPVLAPGWRARTARCGPRLLPRREEGPAPDRVRAAHRPRRPAGRGPGLPGNTADPTAFIEPSPAIVRDTFGLEQMVMVGDRGMITTARIEALRARRPGLADRAARPGDQALAADDGPLQLSLFDEQDLAEISHPDYPGERLIACRNPALAAERARKRDELLAATETLLAPITPPWPPAGWPARTDRGQRRQGHRQVQDGQTLHTSPSPTPP